eukprot:gene9672-20114_t
MFSPNSFQIVITSSIILGLVFLQFMDIKSLINTDTTTVVHQNRNIRKLAGKARPLRGHRERNHTGIYILPIPSEFSVEGPWADIKMPNTSFFMDFEPPNNITKWEIAKLQASRGEQILLQKILDTIKSPTDFVPGDSKFRWVHRIADVLISNEDGGLASLLNFRGHRTPIGMMGFRKFDRPNFEGESTGFVGFGPDNLLNERKWTIPRKFVAVGSMDENWGWLSTYIHNRTVSWAVTIKPNNGMHELHRQDLTGEQVMGKFLNDPNLVMIAVNQHHNFTHPKVLSFPLGISDRM